MRNQTTAFADFANKDDARKAIVGAHKEFLAQVGKRINVEFLTPAEKGKTQEAAHRAAIQDLIEAARESEQHVHESNFYVKDVDGGGRNNGSEFLIDDSLRNFLYTVSIRTAQEALEDAKSAKFPKALKDGDSSWVQVYRKFLMGMIKQRVSPAKEQGW